MREGIVEVLIMPAHSNLLSRRMRFGRELGEREVIERNDTASITSAIALMCIHVIH